MAKPETRTPKPSLGRKISGRVARFSEGVERFIWPLGLAVLAVGAFLGYTAFKATTGPPFVSKYRITVKVPADAPPLRKGQAVRVGGTLAGLIQSVDPDPKEGLTLVEVDISKRNFRPLPVDTTAFVRVKSIVYATYLSLTPGTSDEELVDGDTLDSIAGSGTDLLEVVQLFDKQARADLSKTLINVGFGAAGRGQELNAALQDLPETARNGARQLRALTREPGALAGIVRGAAGTASGLRGSGADDVAGLITAGDRALGVTAAKREQLGETIERLRPFEDAVLGTGPVARPALRDVALTADALGPVLRNLDSQLPRLNTLASLGPELRDGLGALLGGGSSGSAGSGGGGSVGTGTATDGIANQVLVAARPVVFGLFPLQTVLGPLNASLDELLATINPYLPEINQAGLRLQSATSLRVDGGTKPGAPTLRGVPVLTPHSCVNAQPEPGAAANDRATSGGGC